MNERTDQTQSREHGNGRGDPGRIEEEIRQTQIRIEDHIEALRDGFSPGQILDGLLQSLRTGPGGFLSNLGNQMRDNPIPVALIGTGVAWMMRNQRSSNTQDDWASRRQRKSEHLNQSLSHARRQMTETFDAHPLALGAIGLAVGALLGASGQRPGRSIYGDEPEPDPATAMTAHWETPDE